MQTIGQLAARVRVLSPDDSMGRAAEAVRASTVGAAPVVADGRLLGLVTASALTAALAERWQEDLREAPVRELELEPAMVMPEGLRPEDALQFFHVNNVKHAPVLDSAGCLVGMISQADLAMAVCGRVKPAMIGGMATPFGVYLTGGGARGGVGDAALVSTGVFLSVLNLLALWGADWLLSPRGPLTGVPALALPERAEGLVPWVGALLFALLFRLSWVTGYHAAEHQVVHAMEAGDDLRPEVVGGKPRVHPRCGTNLVVAIGIMSLFWEASQQGKLSYLGGTEVLLAMLATFLLWRRVGGWVQQHVTTRPASPRQIENGIQAGRELMARYQEGPPRGGVFRRIWNMGLLQVLAGSMLVFALLALLTVARAPLPEILKLW